MRRCLAISITVVVTALSGCMSTLGTASLSQDVRPSAGQQPKARSSPAPDLRLPERDASLLCELVAAEDAENGAGPPLVRPLRLTTAPKTAAVPSLVGDWDPPTIPPRPASAPPQTSAASRLYAKSGDYSWIQGRLLRVHSLGGVWQVRYAPHDQADEHGGKFILIGALPDDIREGELVRIEGNILQSGSGNMSSMYQVRALRRLETGVAPLAH